MLSQFLIFRCNLFRSFVVVGNNDISKNSCFILNWGIVSEPCVTCHLSYSDGIMLKILLWIWFLKSFWFLVFKVFYTNTFVEEMQVLIPDSVFPRDYTYGPSYT